MEKPEPDTAPAPDDMEQMRKIDEAARRTASMVVAALHMGFRSGDPGDPEFISRSLIHSINLLFHEGGKIYRGERMWNDTVRKLARAFVRERKRSGLIPDDALAAVRGNGHRNLQALFLAEEARVIMEKEQAEQEQGGNGESEETEK